MNTKSYTVRVPGKDSYTTEIAFTFPISKGREGIIILEHKLFSALPDDSKVYVSEDLQSGWYYEDDPRKEVYFGTMKELRDIRHKYIDYINSNKHVR